MGATELFLFLSETLIINVFENIQYTSSLLVSVDLYLFFLVER